MSQSTTNYGFTKPELTDVPDITVLSKNWEMIDSILKSIDMRNKITIVADSTDANSYATQGIYFLNNASNVPSEGKSGLLFVEPWSDSLATLQFWIERTTHEIYLRVKDYSWRAWSQISTHEYFEEFSTELQTNVQSTLSAFSGRIQDNYDYIDTVATALREQIGNTLVTDTISSSLDTSKAYVYVGTSTSTIDKGDWIYYDETEWKSGGVYNSEGYQTNKTLTVSDMAADAKVVGDEITDLKSAIYVNNIEDGFIPFMSSVHYSRTYQGVTASSDGVYVRLNGTSARSLIFRISNAYQFSVDSVALDWTDGIQLEEGAYYRITAKTISGTRYLTNSSEYKPLSVSVYSLGSNSSLGSAWEVNDHLFIREFVAPSGYVNLVNYTTANNVYDNLVAYVTLERIDDNLKGFNSINRIDPLQNYNTCSNRGLFLFAENINRQLDFVKDEIKYLNSYIDFLPNETYDRTYVGITVRATPNGIFLNGTGTTRDTGLRLTNSFLFTGGGESSSWTDGIQLEEGVRYKITSRIVSGSRYSNSGYLPLSVSVYTIGSNSSIGEAEVVDEHTFTRTFTAPSGEVNFVLYSLNGDVYTNCYGYITLEKVLDNIQPYYITELNDTIEKIHNLSTSPALTFMVTTDQHRYSSNANGISNFEYMIENMRYIADRIQCDFILNLGDMTDGDQTQSITLQRGYDCTSLFKSVGIPYLFVNGNHDTNYATTGHPYTFTLEEIFKAYYQTMKNVTYNKSERGTDFYVDFDWLDIRLIVLNANNTRNGNVEYSYGDTTGTWLSGVLNTNRTVVLAVHQSPIETQIPGNIWTYNKTEVVPLIMDFVENGGKLIMLSGHTHFDIAFIDPWLSIVQTCQRFTDTDTIEFLPDVENEYGITGFIDRAVVPSRTAKTATEDAWSVCVLKPEEAELDIVRFGAGTDRYFHYVPISPDTLTTKLTGTITWESSNTSVATVANGTVTAVSSGKCAIIAKDETGNYECWIIKVL